MSKEKNQIITLAEEVLQELVWLSKDRSAEERERRAARRDAERQQKLEQALKPFSLLQLVLRLKSERVFGRARQILYYMRNSQVIEPELRRISEEHEKARAGGAPARPPEEPRERAAWKNALKIAADPQLRLRLAQFHTLCTYKDSGLPARMRLESALQILRGADDLHSTVDQETLGLAGAIHKRLWEVEGLKKHLDLSLHFYRRGYEVGVEKDFGYTAVNAAFVLDLLAEHESRQARDTGLPAREDEVVPGPVTALRKEADRIRADTFGTLTRLAESADLSGLKGEWWFLVTVAEAAFGLGFTDGSYFEKAEDWLELAVSLPNRVPDWEFETTARQLAALARLRSASESPEKLWESEAFRHILPFLKGKAAGLRATLAGKAGLVLSGGGFRAALFHVGALAKLAELDMLRNVEVISCVSAGSIIAALYYLEVRELLQSKPDAEITRDDYVALVMRVERNFLNAVQGNIRTRLGAEFLTNLKTVIFPHYTRTDRVGELLNDLLYSRVGGWCQGRPPMLNELDILPFGEDAETFNPAESNWRRAAKVPALVINATTLNTGHNWQFTTDWMGEPALSIDQELDRNPRLRPVRYVHAPEGYREFPLARAVGASTCTLGLMEPVTLKGLYPGMNVRLVDGVFGGAQCAAAAIERDCNVLLVSDASGQMYVQNDPSQGVLGTTLRSSNILFGQLRAREHQMLESRRCSSPLRGLMFLHMRKGLDAEAVFADDADATTALDDARSQTASELTSYGVLKEVQRRLADIRTDLDAFSDTEAYALMMSGYLMAGHEFANGVTGYPRPPEVRPPWRFLAIEEPMKTVGNKQLTLLLDAARSQLFKFVELSPTARAISATFSGLLFMLLPLLLAAYLLYSGEARAIGSRGWRTSPYFTAELVALVLLVTYLSVLVRTGRKTLSQVIIGIFMCTAGFVFCRLTLHILDPWYLARGRIRSPSTTAPGAAEAGAEGATAGGVLQRISPARPIEYLSQKVDVTGSVKSIGRLIDHARAVEAVAKLFEYKGYETTRYPRDERVNPLQLKLDLHARRGERQIIAVVRTPSDADCGVGGAVSDLDAAIFMASDAGAGAAHVEGLIVLVGMAQGYPRADSLQTPVATRGARRVVTYKEAEIEEVALAKPGDPALDEGARRLDTPVPTGAAGEALPVTGGEA
jgi:predicted acylesterase/phospholipase RssA